MGILYAVGINRYDIDDTAPSVIEALKSSDMIFTEHLGAGKDFLESLGINDKAYVELDKVENEHIEMLDLNNKNASIITGDGYPAITDPGKKLINKALSEGHNVFVLPQVSAIVSAAILSCYNFKTFFYGGMIDFLDINTVNDLTKNSDPMSIFLYQGTENCLSLFELIYDKDREIKLLIDMGHKTQRIIICNPSTIKESIPDSYTYLTIVVSPKKESNV